MSVWSWIDGEFVEHGSVPVTDRGLLHGFGLFETLGVVAGRLPLWGRHIARLRRSAEELGIDFEPREDLQRVAIELAARLARGASVIEYTSSLNVLKDTHDYSCHWHA